MSKPIPAKSHLDLDDDPPGCPHCGAIAGACDSYPNCPGGKPDIETQAMLEAGERKVEDFEKWLRTACFQKPTAEAYDLAKCAWEAALATAESNARDAERYRLARDRQHGVCFWTEWAKPMWRYEQAADDALDAEAARKAQDHE